MAKREQLLSLPTFSTPYNETTVPYPDGVPTESIEQWHLEIDVLNVYEGKVDIKTFPVDYQKRIKDYYRFYGTRGGSKDQTYAKLTKDTMDNV